MSDKASYNINKNNIITKKSLFIGFIKYEFNT